MKPLARLRTLPRRRKVLVLGVLVLLAVWTAWQGWSTEKQAAKNAPQFAEVTRGMIEEVVTAQGKLEPKEYVDVGAQVSGQIKKLYVEIGDVVKKGDPIADLDPRVYEARVEAGEAQIKTLQAQLSEQQANVVLARKQYARNQRLIQARAVSQDELQQTKTALDVAQARIKSIKSQIEQNQSTLEGDKTNLSYTKIFAPIDGTVVLQPIREGQTVNASQTAPVIVQLANLDIMTVRAQVAEADVMRLKTDMDVEFTTLGNMERRWKAKVRQILPSPEVINDVVLYNVLVDVDNKDRQLMTGMSTQMFFQLGRAENVLILPVGALGKRLAAQDNETGQAYAVRVKGMGKPEEKVVHVGLQDRTNAEIKDGVNEGDRVVILLKQSDSGQGQGQGGRRSRPPMGPRL